MGRYIFVILFVNLNLTTAQIVNLDYKLDSDKTSDISLQNNGSIWIATDEGLNAFYDDEKHVFYSNIEDSLSLLNSKVDKLFNTSEDKLMVLSQGGVSVFNYENFNFRQIHLQSSPVKVFEDKRNQEFWISTESTGLYQLDNTFKIIGHYTFDPLNPLSISTSKLSDHSDYSIAMIDGTFVYISTSNGFNVFNNEQGTFKRYFKGEKTSFTSNRIHGLYVVDKDILLFTPNEVVLYDTLEKTFSLLYQSESEIIGFNELDVNRLLIKTKKGNLISSLNERKLEFESNKINSLRFGNKNLNTESGFIFWKKGDLELQLVNKKISDIHNIKLKASINSVKKVKNQVYLATSDGIKLLDFSNQIVNQASSSIKSDFFYVNNNKIFNFSKNRLLISNSLSNSNPDISLNYNLNFNEFIFETDGPNIILGNKDIKLFNTKLNRLLDTSIDSKTLKNITLKNLKLIEDKLYASHDNGIIEINFEKLLNNETEIRFYEFNELLNRNIPRGFYDIEKIDSLLFVTNPLSGLWVFENDFSNFKKQFTYNGDSKTSLAASTPTKLFYVEGENNLYIASLGNGLFRYNLDEKIFSNFNTNNGLLSNNVYDFLYDGNKLYFQSGAGVNYFDDERIKNINQYDGLKIERFHKESLHVFNDSIIVSGYNSQEVFAVSDLNKKNNEFSISIFKSEGIDELNNAKNISLINNRIEVDHTTKTVILDILPSEQYKSQQIQYFLKKEGGTEIQNGFNNQIQLNALPFYTSYVTIYAVNGDGQRSSNNLMLEIYNAPPWWLRVETIFGYLIFLTVSIRAFVNYREKRTKERMEGERKNQELEEAKQLQNSLLPKENPSVNGFDISTYLKPATEIGGDYYDFFYEEGEYFYAICGDATGHGVVSGIMVSVTKAGLNGIPMGEPSTILQQLNRIVKRVNFGRLRMSLSVAQFNKNKFKISSAAMPPTYYFSARDNDIEEILVPNLPLGGIETEKFDGVEKDFHPGDVMVMISDGLPELPNKRNDLLDYPQVFNCIKDNAKKSALEIKDALVELSDEWAEGLMNPDDITIVVIKKAA